MKDDIKGYFKVFEGLFDKIIATGEDNKIFQFEEAVDISIRMIIKQAASGAKIIFIGNGASAAISSHMAVDFWKNGNIRALSFNDSSLLTCVGNDYGYERLFEKPIEMFAEPNDVLIAISSSGRSENILRGVTAARQKRAKVLTLSGFDKYNPLRKLGDVNFYVPIAHYGYVETAHHAICHCLVDMVIKNRLKLAGEKKDHE